MPAQSVLVSHVVSLSTAVLAGVATALHTESGIASACGSCKHYEACSDCAILSVAFRDPDLRYG